MTERREIYPADDRPTQVTDTRGTPVAAPFLRVAEAMQSITATVESLPDDDQATVIAWFVSRFGKLLPF